jgi:O-antigen/teichoic acid export membrane protein
MNPSDKKQLITNTMFSFLARGSDAIFLLVLILAARYLGSEDYGKFSFAFAMVFIFEFVADFGLKELLIREIARKRDGTALLIGTAIKIKLFLIGFTILGIWLLTLVLPIAVEVRIVSHLLISALIFKSFKLLLRSAIMAHERFDLEAFLVLSDRAILLLLCGVALVGGFGLLAFVIAFVVTHGVNLLITALVYFKRIHTAAGSGDTGTVTSGLIRRAIPFGLSAAGTMLYFRIDSIMLGLLRSEVEVGWYSAAYRITEGLLVIPTVLYNVLFPRLSILHQESKVLLEKVVRTGCKYLMGLGLLITVVGITVAEPFILILYGQGYEKSIVAFQVLLLSATFMFLWLILIAVLNSTNHPAVPVFGFLIGAAANVILNAVLIPRYGYVGASIATVVADAILVAILYGSLVGYGYRLGLFKMAVRPLVAALSVTMLSLLFIELNSIVLAVTGSILYLLILMGVGYFDETEVTLFRKAADELRSVGRRLLRFSG